MEFSIMSKNGAFPCEVTVDEENYRFTVRNADTMGEFFNTPAELVGWLGQHWQEDEFLDPQEYQQMMEQLQSAYR
jgi:hypothetical protein